jgi:hypothetical protein
MGFDDNLLECYHLLPTNLDIYVGCLSWQHQRQPSGSLTCIRGWGLYRASMNYLLIGDNREALSTTGSDTSVVEFRASRVRKCYDYQVSELRLSLAYCRRLEEILGSPQSPHSV